MGRVDPGRLGDLLRGHAFTTMTPRGDYTLASEGEEVAWAELIERVAAHGDRAAFVGLFNHYAPRVKAYLLHQGLDAAAAEARAQDVMVAVWRCAAGFERQRASASTWVFRLMRNSGDDRPRRDCWGA
jgi:hypothetical protein